MAAQLNEKLAPAVRQFLDLLAKSQLLAKPLIEKLLLQVPDFPELSQDANRFSQQLVHFHLLTNWQRHRLLKGEWQHFYFGKYRLLEPLSGGGMGRLFLAEQATMNRVVVLKTLHESLVSDPASRARFLREARALATLHHPNIVRAFDHDQFLGFPFLVMEFVEGVNLQEVVQQCGPIAWPHAAHYLAQVAAGLQHAHDKGLVHRDIKPSNLLLEPSGIVKLLDLGLASFFQQRHQPTVTTALDDTVLGTADYLAPEQAVDFHNVDIRADIYSLGAVFYYLLTGQPPFPNGTYAQKLLNHQSKPAPTLQSAGGAVPEIIESIYQQMLAKDPSQRFQTPRELVTRLRPFAKPSKAPFPVADLKFRLVEIQKYLGKGPRQLHSMPISTTGNLSAIDTIATVAPGTDTLFLAGPPLSAEELFSLAGPPTTRSMSTSSSPSTVKVARPLKLPAVIPENAGTSQSSDSQGKLLSPRKRPPRRTPPQVQPKTTTLPPSAVWVISLLTCITLLATLYIVQMPQKPTQLTQNQSANQTASTTHPSGNVTPSNKAAELRKVPDLQGTTNPAFSAIDRWLQYREQIRQHPDLLVYYSFWQMSPEAGEILNEAVTAAGRWPGRLGDPALPATAPQLVSGRWPSKSGIYFPSASSRQYLEVVDSTADLFTAAQSFSLAVWFKATEQSATHASIINKGDSAWRLQIEENSQKIEFALGDFERDMRSLVSQQPVVDQRWHFVVGVFDQSKTLPELYLYIDGQLAPVQLRYFNEDRRQLETIPYDSRQVRPLIPSNPEPIYIGNNSERFEQARSFIGTIDEVLLFRCPLQLDEIQRMYHAGNPYE